MAAFGEALKADRGAGARRPQVLMIIGTDGIPIEKLAVRPDPTWRPWPRSTPPSCGPACPRPRTPGSGPCRSWRSCTERMTTLLVAITPEYFLFAALAPGRVLGPGPLRPAPGRPRACGASSSSSAVDRARSPSLTRPEAAPNNHRLFEHTAGSGPQGDRVDLSDLKEILRILEEQDITEFELEQDGVKLRVCRSGGGRAPAARP